MRKKTEQEIKREILGSFKPRYGNWQPDPEKICAPFENPKAVTRLFCSNCGFTTELEEEDVRKISSHIKCSLQKGGYFEIDGCPFFCRKSITTIVYKQISVQ
jgi:hypothetical protein